MVRTTVDDSYSTTVMSGKCNTVLASWENAGIMSQFDNISEEELLAFIREQERRVMTLIAPDPNSDQRHAAAKLLTESKQALAEKRMAK